MSNKHLAYGPDRHALETVMRLHSVKRWHMVDTTRQQTLAEHSANVALLAMTIAMTSPNPHFDKPGIIAAYGLVHDLPEAFTGDIPTNTKGYLTGLDALEDQLTHPVFKKVNGEGRYPILRDTKVLVKLCDLADGIRFIRLHGVDVTARHAREGIEEQLRLKLIEAADELQWPEAVLKHVRSNIMFYAYENS